MPYLNISFRFVFGSFSLYCLVDYIIVCLRFILLINIHHSLSALISIFWINQIKVSYTCGEIQKIVS